MQSIYKKWGLGFLGAGLLAVLLDALFLEQYFFKVKEFSIGKKNSRRMLRILLLTDLHFVNRLWPFHRRLARVINRLHPDVLLIAGDIIDQDGTAPPAAAFFKSLDPTIPKLAIPGNHDNKNAVSRGRLKKILAASNGRLLANETVRLRLNNINLTVTGLDDFIEGHSDFGEAFHGLGAEENHLALIHSPLQQEGLLKNIAAYNRSRPASGALRIRYIFAGHNHGGQVRLGPLVPVLPEQSGHYINGWYNREPPYLYVSKGFGTSCIRLRFGARAEITLFHYGAPDPD